MFALNTSIFHFLNGFSSYTVVDVFVSIFADLPIFFLPVFLICAWLYYTFKERNIFTKEKLIYTFYACAIGMVIALIIQQFVHLPRPETAISGSGKLLLKHIPDASFPSDHATVSFAFLTALFFLGFKKVFWGFLPFALLMLLSRVIAGVHWPLDILSGILVGIFS